MAFLKGKKNGICSVLLVIGALPSHAKITPDQQQEAMRRYDECMQIAKEIISDASQPENMGVTADQHTLSTAEDLQKKRCKEMYKEDIAKYSR